MSDVRWEPVGNNERIPAVGRIAAMLPDGYALCRATPAATWSQEPPDAPGWYWFVGTLTMIDDDGHVIDHARCSRPNAVFVRSDGYVNYDGMPWSASGSDGHWLPASVPPPPKGADNE